MDLRFNPLSNERFWIFKPVRKISFFLALSVLCPNISLSQASMDDVKKEAKKLFDDDEFTKAYKLYSQLVANFPKEPEYNYRLGVCMIYSEPDKKKCLPFLKQAAANPQDAPKDVNFYLGKAYHINYRFDDAIKCYNEYKKVGSSSQQKKLQVDREIKACSNGKFLLSNLSDLVVQNKKELNEVDYFRSYDLKSIGGKLLVKPDDFKTAIDKKKKEKSVVFLPKGSNVVYYSSYGENTETGKDIYTVAKVTDGSFGKPQKVQGINTEFDEDYPFLHPDGKTLYFASKGHNSMGGYDIFKTVFNDETNTWSQPTNLEFPINSPDDDFLFVTDSLEKTAYFSTGRQSSPGKIDVLKINTERKPLDVLAIKGKVIKSSEEQSLNSTFSVKDLNTNQMVGTFKSEENGEYSMMLPNGGKLLFSVETPGLTTQSQEVNLPVATNSKPFKQSIIYENGILSIRNEFDENASDDNYLDYLKIIEEKAKLEVNEGENKLTLDNKQDDLASVDSTLGEEPKPKKINKPKIIDEETTAATTTNPTPNTTTEETVPVDNKQLAQLANEDAQELKQEADQLAKDARDAIETGQKQKIEADKKIAEANETIKLSESISNEEEKKSILDKAISQKKNGETELIVANKILDYAKNLENDADQKKKESELNAEYSRELLKVATNKNNKSAVNRIEELQKQLNKSEPYKNESENMVNGIKADIEQKENQLATVEKINTDLKSNLEEIKTNIINSESELEKTKKKSAKEKITEQINNYKIDKEEKEKEILANDTETARLNEELTALKVELELTNKIKTEDIAPLIVVETKTNSTALPKAKPTDYELLNDKYATKIVVNNPNDKTSINESSAQISNYNKELDAAISKNKIDLTKAKNTADKQKITNQIKQLETTKKQNSDLIASNKKLIQSISTPIATNSDSKNTNVAATYSPIKAQNETEAVAKLDNLNQQLIFNDNDNFDFNSYQNPQAQSLKVEADARINEAIARQKKLKEEITTSKEIIKNSPTPTLSKEIIESLNKEAEDYHNKSIEIFKEAKTKQGGEKEKLISEAQELDNKANANYILISKSAELENAKNFEINNENITGLIKDSKANETEINQATKLKEEANVAFRKAVEIRKEAIGLSNNGAKLGSYSNAEEKEAEAILKQQQAVDILKKSNPEYVIKAVSPTSENSITSEVLDFNSTLEKVNNSVNELAIIKIESYQKLSQANTNELDELSNAIKTNQTVIDNNPRFKTDFIAANKKLEDSKKLFEEAEKTTASGDKLANLIGAIKKQNEAIKEYNALNKSITAQLPNTNKTETPITTTTVETPTITNQTVTIENPNLISPTIAKETATNTTSNENKTEEQPEITNIPTITGDADTKQTINYFENSTSNLKNKQANVSFKNSISQLKSYEKEIENIDNQINNPNELTNLGSKQNSEQLKNKSDSLTLIGEGLSSQAFKLKKEADTKSGNEKDELIKESLQLEEQALNNNIEAANLLLRSNEMDVQANNNAIVELLGKLANDNPTLKDELSDKNIELQNLRGKANRLRDEANLESNRAAKLGALSNAEEKEAELIQKQNDLIAELKKQYPDYLVKPLANESVLISNNESPELLNKKKVDLRTKQYTELTNLTNALSLEYETSKTAVPKNLNKNQAAIKLTADKLNADSKNLLIKAEKEQDETEKIKQLTQAAKTGNEAIAQLNKITNQKNEVLPNGEVVKTETNNSPIKNTTIKETPRNVANAANTTIKVEGLEVIKGIAYSDTKPIPVNGKIEDGLVFRVQIGAFKAQLPNNTFRGLTPLNAETTANGYFRYTAGNFNKIENANAVKNDLRGLGYGDAFVVAYYNGKRVSLAEAFELLNKEGKTVDANAPQTAGITLNTNIPATANAAPLEKVEVTNELEKVNGLLYTIQIGVYNRQVSKQQLLGLKPIFTEQLPNGLYRYTAGIYNTTERLIADKQKVINFGVRDAFVSAYLNGKKITFADAKTKQANDASIKMEAENPVVFPAGGVVANTPIAITQPISNVKPFNNGITNYPEATIENGIKKTEEGICFKVQVAAYSKQVPNDVAAKLSAIKTWPVENKQINTLFIYNIGNFSEAKYAKTLKEEAIKVGLTDAFITVYKDGQKIYGAEASQYFNR